MPDIAATVISPYQFAPVGDPDPYPVENFELRCLAQGDSWFSIGAILTGFTTNIPQALVLSRSTLVVDCARPGKVLELMTSTTSDPKFIDLLCRPNTRWPWDALLLSGGGNDLIAAACIAPTATRDQRLFLRPDEWGAGTDVSRYLSDDGWATFAGHMTDVFGHLVIKRDAGVHPDMPIVMHDYDFVTPRDAPAGPGFGPWLYKAMHDLYAIPDGDWNALSDLLISKLRTLLRGFAAAYPNVVLVDAVGNNAGAGTLTRAVPGTTGPSNDWENEIHPTPGGYDKLAALWRPVLDALPRLDPV